MKIVRGVVAMLGYTHVRRKSVIYSVVEIGQQIVPELSVPKSLIKYLVKALRSQEESALFILDGRLVGIQLSDNSVHYHHVSRVLGIIFILISVALIPLFGLGLIALWYSYKYLRYAGSGALLAQEGARRSNA